MRRANDRSRVPLQSRVVSGYSTEEVSEIIDYLRTQPAETEWLEFKTNVDPERLGKYLSALANSAALANRSSAYLVFGIEDETHDAVGTEFNPSTAKHKNQMLQIWLKTMAPAADFEFTRVIYHDVHLVLVEVRAAVGRPVDFAGTAYIRVGSSLTELRRDPNREGRLWDILRNSAFEEGVAKEKVTDEQLLRMLDLGAYFIRSRNPAPESAAELVDAAVSFGATRTRPDGKYDVTNLGALLFARDLSQFPSVEGKAIRVVQYAGSDRAEVTRRQDGTMGYAVGFTGLLNWLKALLPAREIYRDGERLEEVVFSDLLLRETIANALIHQDLTVRGAGPRIEVFTDRIEITNPGVPLIAPDRMLNSPPVSRNPALARLMRQMRLCEEYGTGWDRIATETENAGLPAPLVETQDNSLRVTILGPRKLTAMAKNDQLWAVYLHACLQWANTRHLTNASLRERFGISSSNSAQVSRLIGNAVEAKLIVLYDETVGHKAKSYVPYWAR